jgi:uncharacterized LabA/DUF88 family protein
LKEEFLVNDKVAIFIDGSNLYHALESNFKRHDLNFTEFANKLTGTRKLFRIYYYNILQDPTQWPETHNEQQDFLDGLLKTPFLEIHLGTTKIAQGIHIEKGVDLMLATDLVDFAWNNLYDVAILVSGDADFIYAIHAVKNRGKHVEIAYFDKSVSKDLWNMADDRHLLDRAFFKGLWVSKRYSKRKRPSRGKIRDN